MSRQQWLVLMLLGLLLMVIALPVSKGEDKKKTSSFSSGTEKTDETKTELETKLENLLKQAEGVGKVKVMLMTDTGQEFYNSGNEVTGVLIVAEGADNSVTVRKIQEAVMALFQIEAHKIRIMKMK